MNNNTAISEDIYDYVFHNSGCNRLAYKPVRYSAHITLCGYDYNEIADSSIEARAKLANELSKSKFIRNNFSRKHEGHHK